MSNYKEQMRLSRFLKHLSQREVAKRVGISQAAYSEFECGYRVPTKDVAKQLIEVLGLPEGIFDGADTADNKGHCGVDRSVSEDSAVVDGAVLR